MENIKTTDAVIRELNEWISGAKSLVEQVLKTERQESDAFWKSVAEQTGLLAENAQAVLKRVTSLAHDPDEITDGMKIAALIDDIAFETNIIAFQIAMIEAKMPQQTAGISFAEKYHELALSGAKKAIKIASFFRELLLLVVEDMRKTADDKIRDAIEKGKKAANNIPVSYNYFKEGIMQLVDELSVTPAESITVLLLNDCLFKMKLFTITAKLNIDAADKTIFDEMGIFTDSLNDAVDFFRTIAIPKDEPSPEYKLIKKMQDIVYQVNVLFFNAKGEIESLITDTAGSEFQAQKVAFDSIRVKINDFLKIAFNAEREENNVSVFMEIADKLYDIVSDLYREADKLESRGGAIKVIANEQKRLAEKIVKCLKDIEDLIGD